MRVLITGAAGQVGYELMRLVPEGFEAQGLDSAALDITQQDQVEAVVVNFAPDLIINAAAYTAVDKAETDTERAWAVNRDGAANLGAAAERVGIPVFHISTDYVFAGDADQPYRETDPAGPTGIYGASKLAGEVGLAASCSRYLVLRTSWVFGAHGSNFVKTMLRLGKERDTLGVVADQQGCPTSAASIASVLWIMARRYITTGSLAWGTYHFSNAPVCTWYDFACEIFQQAVAQGILTKSPVVNSITTADYPTPARRPANSFLNCSKIMDYLSSELPDWRTELAAVIKQLEKQNSQE